ncbi:lytic murein transglycosylase [Loktanella salsilacus]|jgi:lytic murein transglycosylase|uniref:lytic murein transglycosylase n=1 Tax=Loktanella salsilacus TaxID=195913 RepID=UPI0020B6D24B|nr:lytic murein transglycosylase [Loktanella salsilacus]UTH44998.1 lytic murein transglycosylase [Loktanella salsilacus]
MRLTALLLTLATPLAAQDCGAPLPDFKAGVLAEATAMGIAPDVAEAFLSSAQIDPAVLKADRAQGVFQLDFVTFSRRLISTARLDAGKAMGQQYSDTFAQIEAQYGIPRGVLLAFWAFETDYGAIQGDFNTRNALFTLAHDCRRPELFRPELLAAMQLYAREDFDLGTTGAWAGEIGQVQMLPRDIIAHAVDGDGDGHIDLKGSADDALMSGAALLSALGWRANEPALQEITVPESLDWSRTGLDHELPAADWAALGVTGRGEALSDLPGAVLLPMGRNGPAFMAYPNFSVYFEWNQSLTYVTTAAYFATRLAGAQIYDAGNADPGLDGAQMMALQEKLAARGYDVGGIDGILGEKTREAVQLEQARLGLPADAWPTAALLGQL